MILSRLVNTYLLSLLILLAVFPLHDETLAYLFTALVLSVCLFLSHSAHLTVSSKSRLIPHNFPHSSATKKLRYPTIFLLLSFFMMLILTQWF